MGSRVSRAEASASLEEVSAGGARLGSSKPRRREGRIRGHTHCDVVLWLEGSQLHGLRLGVVEVRLFFGYGEVGRFEEALLVARFLCCFLAGVSPQADERSQR